MGENILRLHRDSASQEKEIILINLVQRERELEEK